MASQPEKHQAGAVGGGTGLLITPTLCFVWTGEVQRFSPRQHRRRPSPAGLWYICVIYIILLFTSVYIIYGHSELYSNDTTETTNGKMCPERNEVWWFVLTQCFVSQWRTRWTSSAAWILFFWPSVSSFWFSHNEWVQGGFLPQHLTLAWTVWGMEPHTQAALLLLMHVIQILLKVKSFVVVLHISFVLFVASYGCFVLRFK